MKPVPISQYLDHIGRVAQADSQPSRRETPAFKPRAIRVVHDPEARAAPAMSRVLREAANAARAPQTREERRERADLETGWLARESVSPREEPPAPDVEERIAEAYERGLREGAEAARAEDAESLAREETKLRDRALEERVDFQLNEYARLAEVIANGLAEIEERIAASVTRILAPLLTTEMTKRIIDELGDDVARLCSGGSPGLVKIRGPERLLAALRERVADLPAEVELVEEDAVEITVEAQHTVIRSQLRPWADLIASLAP
jgi:flagellar biosynthesis/type III secretory pathway protein FliH